MSLIERAKLLIEEYKLIAELWKFNRDLALRRYQINFLINSATMTAAATVAAIFWEQASSFGPMAIYIVCIAILGVLMSGSWFLSLRRHHRYIYLKMHQAIECEQRLNELLKDPAPRMFRETRDLLAPEKEEGKGSVNIAGKEMQIGRFEKHSSSWFASYIPIIFIAFWVLFAFIFLFSRPSVDPV